MNTIDAYVTAGGIPGPKDPLYSEAKGGPKTMIELAGKPMVQWVIDALDAAETIGRILVVGLDEKCGLTAKKPLYFHPDQGGFFENIIAGRNRLAELDPAAEYGLGMAGDIPGIRPEMVDWLVRDSIPRGLEAQYVFASREVIEAEFPGSGRTFIPFKDGRYCGGSINIININKPLPQSHIWWRLSKARKSPVRMAVVIGPKILFGLLFRRLTVEGVMKVFCRRFKATGRPVFSPYAELAMDVDKPRHLEIMRRHLAERSLK
ncbi:MAG: NTP transferase domain-containing protein [Candidatus Aminicenantes bacterium]|nr:NTP transferase domain-containing protein [Candidatus Aminicenantes bacterium]